jgi:hypothetical protein
MSRWISPQALFNRLLSLYNGNGWTVGEIIEGALRRGDLRLRRNGVVLSPADIRNEALYVHVELSRDGRWTCTIESHLPRHGRFVEVDDTGPVQMIVMAYPPPPKWELSEEGIEALGPQTRARHEPAWLVWSRKEIQRLAGIHSNLLENYGALYPHIGRLLERLEIPEPANQQRFRRAIRNLCEEYRGKGADTK